MYLMVCVAAFTPCTYGQCSFATSAVGEPLTYVIEPVVVNGRLILRVTLEFRGGRAGTVELLVQVSRRYDFLPTSQ